jgi:hypothetical protein
MPGKNGPEPPFGTATWPAGHKEGVAFLLVAEHRLWIDPVATATARTPCRQIGHVSA